MTYDGSNRKHIRAAEKAAEIAAAKRQQFIRRLMQDIDGREWMHNLLTQCHVFHTPFAAGQPDVTGFRCGEQNLGLQIFADVVAQCPNEYVLMMQEANAKEIIDDRRYSGSEPVAAEPAGRGEDAGRNVEGRTDPADGDETGSESGWTH